MGYREALRGAVIGALFGIAWMFWAASGLSGALADVVRVVGLVAGVAILVGCRRALRRIPAEPTEGGQHFGRGYWAVVVAEVVALYAGIAVLGATGHDGGRAAWVALVVGVHFLALARIWSAVPLAALGAVLTVAGVVVLGLTLAGALSDAALTVAAALPSGVAMLAGAAATLGPRGRSAGDQVSGEEPPDRS